ncbi:hypothetical protein Alches_12670 [Alicyclobacillus hesperidum subsp. aegles]|uniref:DUF7669 domain-containing protein n=1 Tax=Alicyclobacillus tolerans TaxID=90970 RepID=A0A1M6LL00_9BACL|nr:hypothetical protein Alches_12670 [Alicyclobacillus hesperidum subsp. aegles]SHJ71867.1 hypothetical protein SAMN05443507_1035 [Alicyclobacillus montanus]
MVISKENAEHYSWGAERHKSFHGSRVVDYMKAMKTTYPESTIRTHVTSLCCVNAPNHHATVFSDFERMDRGVYRIHKLKG